MPIIHITSLPFEQDLDSAAAIKTISREFADKNGIELQHVTMTWTFLGAHNYAENGETCEFQLIGSHKILVDMAVPDFNSRPAIEKMLTTLANSIARHCDVPVTKIFINLNLARSGLVFDEGQVVHW